ncbi:tRNA (pseudouridine(54)-N(1))-methyltransferase TrmY [Halovenus marina]|uniref:tRNA (pseudouridine(54)-N(1))-methyltransferase TrmY n=1 Tax=Halovenus marina TaxID=3396621 RepID=UPI003F57A49B
MRQFVIVSHEAPAAGEFSLDDLPGAGRMDLLARAVNASLLRSHGIRSNVRTHLVVGEYTVQFEGATLQGLNPDERSTAARIRDALASHEDAIGHIPVEIAPGISLVRKGLAETLADLEGTVVCLHEDGDGVGARSPPDSPVFVLSDHHDFTDEERETIDAIADQRYSLGPERLHADHAITVAHNWLDTEGFTEY